MTGWLIGLYLTSVVGAVFGIFWPAMVASFKGGGQARLAVAFDDSQKKIALHLGLGIVIASVIAGLGFVAFAGTTENQTRLHGLGLLAYFTAFTSGFSAASLIEEPLKQ